MPTGSAALRFDPTGPHEVETSDVVYARPAGRELLAAVHRPASAGGALPAVVNVHGGAWTRGDRGTDASLCRALAACGLVVVSLDFRQGPDHQHPAASADVAAGIRFVRSQAARLGVDPRRLGLVGSSSGGHLALLAGVKPGAHPGTPVVRADGGLDDAPGDETVAFVVALYPVCDPLARYRYVLGREHEPPLPSGFSAPRLIAAHRGYYRDEAAMAEASVTRVVAAGEQRALPPIWVAQPELDDNVPAAITEAFVQAYRAAGGAVEHALFPGARHSFNQTPGPDTDKCVALIRDFIGRQLAGA